MSRHRGDRSALTLIEVLIVVTIIALLAGTVITQISSSIEDVRQISVTHNLRLLQSEIEVYRMDHLGGLPWIQDNDLPQLYRASNTRGEMGESGPNYPYGPYVSGIAENAFDGSNKVSPVAVSGQAPSGVVGALGGWQYDQTTGAIWANHPLAYQRP